MRLRKLQPGFSTADTSYPEFVSSAGRLLARFKSSAGQQVQVEFSTVAAVSWQENSGSLLPGESWDGTCELFDSPLLASHTARRCMR